jgi:rRNA maturation RNase YbeY
MTLVKLPRKKALSRPARRSQAQSAQAIWTRRAEKVLDQVVERAKKIPALKKRAPHPQWTIEVSVVGQARMRQLNREARGKDKPTDVLSFELPPSFRTQGLIGSIVICLPVLKAQAKAQRHAAATELEVLVVHGLLHLLGYDHERGPRAARVMAGLERKLIGPLMGPVLGRVLGPVLGLIQR